MRPGAFHQFDTGPLTPAEAIAEPGHEFEPRRATANDNHAMKGFALRGLVLARCQELTIGSLRSSGSIIQV
jgi:hypothetical protein